MIREGLLLVGVAAGVMIGGGALLLLLGWVVS